MITPKFTQNEIDTLKNFKDTYQKYNPTKHEDYDKVCAILDRNDLVPSDALFKKKLDFTIGVIDGTAKVDRFYGECYLCSKHFKKSKPSSFMCDSCRNSDIQYCKKHHYVHGLVSGYSSCLQCDIDKSHKKYKDKTPVVDYVECKLCGLQSGDLASHYQKIHGLEYSQYSSMPIKKDSTIEKMKGENNPGYQHGGKLSPMSKNFVKYQGMESSDVESSILGICEKSTQSRKERNSNNTTLEYYVAKGMSLEEAQDALSERQMTFSLDRCIERHGEEKGLEVWKKRQEKWMGTMNSKTDEEKDRAYKNRVSNFIYDRDKFNCDIDGMFYILEIEHEGRQAIKIGITTHDVEKRYGRVIVKRMVRNKETYKTDIHTAFRIEQLLKEKFKHQIIDKEEVIQPFGWTETFTYDVRDDLLEYYDELIQVEETVASAFDRVFLDEDKDT